MGASFAGAFLGSILDNYGLIQRLMVMAIVSVVSGLLAILV